jgi:hypothetical protein
MLQRSATPLPSWPRRIGWLILIWAASVAALAVVALAFRVLMKLAGLSL